MNWWGTMGSEVVRKAGELIRESYVFCVPGLLSYTHSQLRNLKIDAA